MPTSIVTKKELTKAARDVREVVQEARRRLFELETLQYIHEIEEGKFSTYDSMSKFWVGKKRKR